jgi:hypothetical protein
MISSNSFKRCLSQVFFVCLCQVIRLPETVFLVFQEKVFATDEHG